MITTVFIDVDNTLLDFEKSAKSAMKSALKDWGLNYCEELFKVFESVNHELWTNIENNRLTKERLYQIRWQMIFEQMNIQADGVKFEQRFLEYLTTNCYLISGARELLEYLSPNIPFASPAMPPIHSK